MIFFFKVYSAKLDDRQKIILGIYQDFWASVYRPYFQLILKILQFGKYKFENGKRERIFVPSNKQR
jgi:hypothetical protein